MTTAARRVLFCRSGGGLPGLQAHAGMWMALHDAGIDATHVTGTSAGGIVSAFDAAGHPPSYCAAVLGGLRTEDVAAQLPAWKLRMFWLDSFIRNEPIRALLARHLPDDWAAYRKPLTVYATDVTSGLGVGFSAPPPGTSGRFARPREAVLASMSIAGVFPHVGIAGGTYSDGGTFNNPALPDDWRTFDEVWLLVASGYEDTKKEGHGILTRLLRNAFFYGRGQLSDAMTETGLLGPYATLSVQEQQRELRQVLKRGWATSVRYHAETSPVPSTRVTMLWPPFKDDGALRFVEGLIESVYRSAAALIMEARAS